MTLLTVGDGGTVVVYAGTAVDVSAVVGGVVDEVGGWMGSEVVGAVWVVGSAVVVVGRVVVERRRGRGVDVRV